MKAPPPTFPLRHTPATPWRPMTDPEWTALATELRLDTPRPGRPPANPRQTWDAIFWVAASKEPWAALPAHLGKPDTAHRALRRAALAKTLHLLLLAASPHPDMRAHPLQALRWFIARAFRRAWRIAPLSLWLPRRLGLADALPAPPRWLPDEGLSETVTALALRLRETRAKLSFAGLHAFDTLRRRAFGQPRMWKTTG